MEHTPENLEYYSSEQQKKSEQSKEFTPRPKGHQIAAWILIAIVLFAFLGTCYWLAAFGKG